MLVGYSALIDAYELKVPLPRFLSAIGKKHRILEKDGWRLLTPRHAPEANLEGNLIFAVKYEGLNLGILKRLFLETGPSPIEILVRTTPTGSYARRIWFLYEWLTGEILDLPNATKGSYFSVLDEKMQWAAEGETSSRHRIKNNLPGTRDFCPLVFRTEELERFIAMDLPERVKNIIGEVPRDLLARTAAFLMFKDSKSSYAIEGEKAPLDRVQRWGRALGEAGRRSISVDELLRLQHMVIGDARFVKLGLRRTGGFVGAHDHQTQMPIPDHISARPEDLSSIIAGMIDFDKGWNIDPAIVAAILAFGFVFVHPFEDGNGRVHRYLIHHVLAERGFNPPGLVIPISAAILDQMDAYRRVLEEFSKRLLPLIDWEPTEEGNVRVISDTADFYRYFDATPQAEFLYGCVRRTIEEDLPNETDFLRRFDRFKSRLEGIADMSDRRIDLLFRFLQQSGGGLSKRARDREFSKLEDKEAKRIETIYSEVFGDRF